MNYIYLLVIAGLLLIALSLSDFFHSAQECNGVLERGVVGFECMQSVRGVK